MTVADEKKALRARITRQIEQLPEAYLRESDGGITDKVFSLPEYKNADTLYAYYGVEREVSTKAVIERALCEGKTVALPVSGKGGVMHFYAVSDLSRLVSGRFNIPEPPRERLMTPGKSDLMLVPALCCDKTGTRLGHGAGYYDRYLALNPCFTVCLCRKRLLLPFVPAEPTDRPVDMVLTES